MEKSASLFRELEIKMEYEASAKKNYEMAVAHYAAVRDETAEFVYKWLKRRHPEWLKRAVAVKEGSYATNIHVRMISPAPYIIRISILSVSDKADYETADRDDYVWNCHDVKMENFK